MATQQIPVVFFLESVPPRKSRGETSPRRVMQGHYRPDGWMREFIVRPRFSECVCDGDTWLVSIDPERPAARCAAGLILIGNLIDRIASVDQKIPVEAAAGSLRAVLC